MLQLKTVLRAAPLLAAALTSEGNGQPPMRNELLCKIVDNLTSPELEEMAQRIDAVIEEDAAYCRKASQHMFECLFAVKSKVCSFLDVTRTTLIESAADMENIIAAYSDTYGITDIRLVYSDRRGYHLKLPASQRHIAEANGFIRIASQAKKTVACTTEQLGQLNLRCKDMIGQILISTEAELTKLQEAIRSRLHVIFSVGESVALLDMLGSFATFVSASGAPYARPCMGDGAILVLKQCRHPLLEAQGDTSVVANDVMITHACKFQLITGPNMSGKTTYLRQSALIVLLAHIGCHVPAEAATVPLFRRVFTRIGSSDSLETNGSTFACEMRETTYILRNLGEPSLVLVDELGRGTSNRDGASLSWAVAEELALQPTTFTLFATHYLQLANLRNLYPSHVRTLVLAVEPAETRLRFLYSVKEGVASKRAYMTDFLAEVAGFPPQVCSTAKALADSVDFDPVDQPSRRATTHEAYALVAERLIWMRRSTTMDEESRRAFLRDLKSRLRTEVAKCGGGPSAEDATREQERSRRQEDTRANEQTRQLAAAQQEQAQVEVQQQPPQPQPQLQLRSIGRDAQESVATPALPPSAAAPARRMTPPMLQQLLQPLPSVTARAGPSARLQHELPAFGIAGAKRSRAQAAGSGGAGPAAGGAIDGCGSLSEEAAEAEVEVEAEADHTVIAQRRRSHAPSPLRQPSQTSELEPAPISLRPLDPVSPPQLGAAGAPPHDNAVASPPLSFSPPHMPTTRELHRVVAASTTAAERPAEARAEAATSEAATGEEEATVAVAIEMVASEAVASEAVASEAVASETVANDSVANDSVATSTLEEVQHDGVSTGALAAALREHVLNTTA